MATKILDFSEENGLVLCNQPDKAQNSYERLYLHEASKLNAFAVFFRRFFKSKEDTVAYKSEPSVCIFKEDQVAIKSEKHLDLHAALWSEGKIDIYIILGGNTRIDIYNVKKPVEKIGDELSLKHLLLASKSIDTLDKERFSAKLFGQGTFWEQVENQHHITVERSPYKHLVDYLMRVRKQFINSETYNLDQETVDKLLVLSILIKFLEEKKDTYDDKSTLDEIYAKHNLQSIEDVREGSQLLSIIEDLANEFNGKIFDQFEPEEKTIIRNTNLSLLCDFLKGDIEVETRQLFFWRQYSFHHLPTEVISAIYENFIQAEAEKDGTGKEKGVVYTPIHLVNFLIDEAMPLDNPPESFVEKGEYKILDPTCGSGVFLVAAYKRLLQWWTISESKKTGKITYPDVATAQKILEDNIFGVDVKSTAVRVTIFGLTTALLDFLTPKEVWGKLKFKDLTSRNITRANTSTGFFQWALEQKNNGHRFSLAVGNPPFNPEKHVIKGDVLNKSVITALDLKHKDIPRKNFALHFFEAAMTLCDQICMIIPSNALLYDKSAHSYRKALFTNYSVKHIFDFTHLRRELFSSADTPVLALIGSNSPSNCESIGHTVVKRTISSKQRTRFEIDDYDIHYVKWDWAVDPEKQFIWKTNLLGGGRLFHLITRLKSFDTLEDFVNNQKAENPDWIYSSGYKIGGESTKKYPATYLTNKKTIDTKIKFNFQRGGFSYTIEKNEYFEAPRSEKLYQPPVLVIAEILQSDHIPMQVFEEPQPFNISFIGIHAPSKENLLYIKNNIHQNFGLLRAFMLATSPKLLINKETTFVKEDLDNLPIIPDSQQFYSDSEQIIIDDLLKFQIHQGKSITNKSAGAILHRDVKRPELLDYGKVLCTELNDIYENKDNCWQIGTIFKINSYTVFQIGFGKNGRLKHEFKTNELDPSVEELINNESANRGATFRRVIRFYDHVEGFDCIYFVKPNALRYWLKSIALRDADETFIDLRKEGY